MKETHYKQTDIGQVPEEWEVVRLGEVGEVKMCKRIMKWQTSNSGDVPFYKIGTFGGIPDAYISNALFEAFRTKYSYPKLGEILLSAAGTIGRKVRYNGEKAYFQDSNIVWLGNDETVALNDYLFYAYDNVEWETSTGTIPRLYNDNVRAIQIPLPPLPEQRRIASALGAVDALLDSLARLIEKKRDIRTATMQQLLTQKTRLKGFTEEWNNVRLGEAGLQIVKGEGLTSSRFIPGPIKVIAGGQVEAGYHNVANHSTPTITISASGAYAGYVWLHEEPIFATDCSVIVPSNNYDLHYIYYLLKHKQEDIYKEQTGGAQPHIHPDTIKAMRFPLPPLPEQRAISSVLSSLDADLSALERKREKVACLKAGMMQELLTGRTRLID